MKKTSLLALLLLVGLTLSGCSWIGLSSDDEDKAEDADKSAETTEADKEAAKPEEPKTVEEAAEQRAALPICPQVAIVRDLDSMRDYGGMKPDVSELVAGAKLLAVEGHCEYTDTGIDVRFTLNMVAARGARLGGKHVSFPFFAAVVEPAGNILNKERMTADFTFSGEDRTANRQENLHVFIPLSFSKRGLGPDYRVLMGFQLNSEEQTSASR